MENKSCITGANCEDYFGCDFVGADKLSTIYIMLHNINKKIEDSSNVYLTRRSNELLSRKVVGL